MKLLLILFIAIGLQSCSKDSNEPDGTPVTGTILLQVHIVHHSWDVAGIPVYLKKNAVSFPGKDSSIYELHMTTNSDGIAEFENLFPGNYYLYASGYDNVSATNVLGYSAVVLNESTVTNNEYQKLLYVSE